MGLPDPTTGTIAPIARPDILAGSIKTAICVPIRHRASAGRLWGGGEQQHGGDKASCPQQGKVWLLPKGRRPDHGVQSYMQHAAPQAAACNPQLLWRAPPPG